MSEDFLSRWSRLKRSGGEAKATPAAAPAPVAPPAQPSAKGEEETPTPLESLEPGADIAQFMKAEVAEGLKRQALKKLLQDPRFNVMDGLDVYIDDYSQPDPLPAGWLEKMNQTVRFGEYREPEPEDSVAEAQPAAEPQEPVAENASGETPSRSDTPDEGFPSAESTQSSGRT